MLYLLLLVPISFGIFAFVSNQFNIITAPRPPLKRRQWKLGRAAALASLTAGSLVIAFSFLYPLDERATLSAYLIMTALLLVPSVMKYHKSSFWR